MARHPSDARAQAPTPAARRPSARERILQTARDSFYREGIRAVGVDTLIARSGVAKMSFYRSFRSKDELVCAYLECFAAEFWKRWDDTIRPYADSPKKQLRALFVAQAERISAPDFRGCPFANTLVEFPEAGCPARAVIARFRAERRNRLRDLAKAAGARNSEGLADQLGILFEGSTYCAETSRAAGTASALLRAAEALIDAETRHNKRGATRTD